MLLGWVVEELRGGRRVAMPKGIDEGACMSIRFLSVLAPELHHEPRLPVGEHRSSRRRHALLVHVAEQAVIDPLECDGAVRITERDLIGSAEDVREAEDDEGTRRRAVDEP